MKSLYIIDLMAMIYRGYHAYQKNPKFDGEGQVVNSIYSTLVDVMKVCREYKPDYLIFCSDLEGDSFRNDISPLYKANRSPRPEEIKKQIPLIEYLIKDILDVPLLSGGLYEADDFVGSKLRILKTVPILK